MTGIVTKFKEALTTVDSNKLTELHDEIFPYMHLTVTKDSIIEPGFNMLCKKLLQAISYEYGKRQAMQH
jgi:hypothetical protein